MLNRPVDPIEEGIDLALRVRSRIQDSTTLVVKTIGTSLSIVVASPDLLNLQEPMVTPDDLSRLDTVAIGVNDGRSGWQLEGPDGQA